MEIDQILAVTRFGAAVLYGHQGPLPHSGPRFTYALYGSGACVLVAICPTLRAYLRGRDDWTWGLRFRSSWSWCLCPVSDCRPFVEDYLVAALESDMSSISPRMPRTLTSLAKLDPLSASTGISQISSLLSSGIGFPLDLNYGLRGVFRIRQSFCHRLQHTSRSRIS